MGYVDLHSHILPGIDDGARDPAMSLTIIGGLRDLGFDTICATPHQKAGQFLPSLAAIEAAHAATVAAVAAAGIAVTIPLGAENMWDDVFFQRVEDRAIPSYDGRSPFLVEFRTTVLPLGLREHVFRIRAQGKLPVIAHPERYQPLWKRPELVDELAAECAMVVDLGAVAGYHGRGEAKAARRMLQRGQAHAAASDSHNPADILIAARGIAWIRKKLGADAVTRLLDEAPRRILAGEHPAG